MKKQLLIAAALVLGASLITIQAQPRGRGGLSQMGGGMAAIPATFGGANGKLFGQNTNFSANLEMHVKPASGDVMDIPGKVTLDQGSSRMEMDMTKATGTGLPPDAATMMKSMGMDVMITISRPDKKVVYLIYPGMKAYVENAITNADTEAKPADFKVETTELGKETFDGHACVKNKVVVTDDKEQKHESTVWNATDLKNFPIKFEQTDGGDSTTIIFKDVKIGSSPAGTFDAPSGFTKYDNAQTMMMQEMMKRRGGG